MKSSSNAMNIWIGILKIQKDDKLLSLFYKKKIYNLMFDIKYS